MGHSSRSSTRVSRPLIAALGLTIVAGSAIYYDRAHSSKTPSPSDRESIVSLKSIDPAVMSVSSSASPVKPTRPEPAILPAALITQTPVNASSTPPSRTAAPIKLMALSTTNSPVASPVASTPKSGPVSSATSSQILADAKAKLLAGDFLGARVGLNSALVGGQLASSDLDSARKTLSEISQTVIFSKKRFKDDPFQTVYQVVSGDRVARIAEHHQVTWELLCRINGLASPKKLRSEQWIKIPNGPFHCVITKSAYRLDVYLGSPGETGSLLVTSFPVGLGKDNSTPTGVWMVQQGNKAHPATYYSPRGEGVIAATDPKNPLGGYWMGLTGISGNAVSKDSYGIHGTVDPDSIGKQASMGCIRLGHDDIALLYELLVDGKSKVVVKD